MSSPAGHSPFRICAQSADDDNLIETSHFYPPLLLALLVVYLTRANKTERKNRMFPTAFLIYFFAPWRIAERKRLMFRRIPPRGFAGWACGMWDLVVRMHRLFGKIVGTLCFSRLFA